MGRTTYNTSNCLVWNAKRLDKLDAKLLGDFDELLEGRGGRGYKWPLTVVRDHLLLDARHVAVGIVRHQRLVGRLLLGHLVLKQPVAAAGGL